MFLHQTFDVSDLAVIGLLVVLEGVLSIDNALVLGLLARRLPKHQQGKALTYGLAGAVIFRLVSVFLASSLLRWKVVKLLGGGYLLYIAVKHLIEIARKGPESHAPVADAEAGDGGAAAGLAKKAAGFWGTVLVIELTDIAFAVDSILAAIALVGPPPRGTPIDQLHPKLWVVVAGGLIGVALMRVAAVMFIKLLERFPRFEMAAYLLVAVIGVKLLIDYVGNDLLAREGQHPVDFHSAGNVWFWAFWGAMLISLLTGFIGGRKPAPVPVPAPDATGTGH